MKGSVELAQSDGAGMMEHEQLEQQIIEETAKANDLRKTARNSRGTTHAELLAHQQQARPPSKYTFYNTTN